MAAKTGNDDEINKRVKDMFCEVLYSIDPTTGEELSGTGGFMVKGDNHLNNSGQIPFDAR